MKPDDTTQRKEDLVRGIFATVSGTYDLLNHVLTFHLDTLWRRKAAAAAVKTGGHVLADICTGTGETAVYIRQLAPEGAKVYAMDFSLPMMKEAIKKPGASGIQFVASDVKQLPFPNDTFDVITISFATRNINLDRETLVNTFSEIHRVLKPGGSFINIETSQPSNPFIRKCFHLYIKMFVEGIGSRLSGSRTAYAYLARTIPRFYDAPALSEILLEAGFASVTFSQMFFGITALHKAIK